MMRIAIVVLGLIVLSPGAGMAQEIPPGLRAAVAALEAGASPSPQQAVQQPPVEPERRRRPSMVGYIGDGIIESKVRIRFDLGYGMTSPDRAEFFYAKCGCYRDLPPELDIYDPAAPGPGPGVLTDLDFQQFYLLAEYAPSARFSVFGEIPVRWLQPQSFLPGTGSFGDQSGLSDVRMGLKLGLVAGEDQAVTLLLQAMAPTGEPLEGLGTDHWSVEPALLVYQALSDRVAIESQLGIVIPTSGSAGIPTNSPEEFSGNVLYYGIGPSFVVYDGDAVQFAPIVEIVGWRVLGGFETATFTEADGVNIVNAKVGGRLVFRNGSSFYVGYGHALTDADWYDDILRLEYRFAF